MTLPTSHVSPYFVAGLPEQAQILANEIGVCRQTVQAIRQQLQANAQHMQPDNPLDSDEQTETDELYQNAGEKK